MTGAPDLSAADLHGSLQDPVLGAIGFLNEVMDRHPDAISFAPGAPHPDFVQGLDLRALSDRFLTHLRTDRGLDPSRAERVLYEYGPAQGLINDLVTEALRTDQGIHAAPEDVVITVGAQEAMLLTLRALYRDAAHDVLAVADPCFPGIVGAARLLGIPVTDVREDAAGLDVEHLAARCRQARSEGRRVRACYVAPDFSNPGGARMTLDARHALLDLAEREDLLLVEDNAYAFTAPEDDALPGLKALDTRRRVVHLGTFAKVGFPGARVGYAVADQRVGRAGGTRSLARELADLKTMVTVNTSPLSQAVVGGLLLEHGRSLRALARRKADRYRSNLAHLTDALERHLTDDAPAGVSWHRPAGGFFARVDLPVPADLALLEVSADRYGVLWTPMRQFSLTDRGDRQIRLSCSYLEPDRIETGVRRLAAFLKKEAAG
ncbi:PLP-dependent aminotransferase family protein [Streptomyces olivaceus]|uniref:aminotransferase-like domain-containing protein n=1 Tax=Streptomyces olivaceus TaxID=47716 RepID=UPI0018A8624A|nr:PLP-dependent aminotransferase family protein [Streptomyces olivaceus]MBF8175197.1 PLP-dependent aminotransferase family protein [Streptomyces olivaceus]